jgi:hypothetical protein
MLDRSSRVRALSAALAACLAVLLALCGPALAQEPAPVPVPADAPTVAGPSADGTTLIAFVHGADLCLVPQRPGAARPTRVGIDPDGTDAPDDPDAGAEEGLGQDAEGTCTVRTTLAAYGVDGFDGSPGEGPDLQYGVTGAAAASVALRRDGAVVTSGATGASPLPGAAAGVRFFVLTAPLESFADELALVDALGTVQRVTGRDDFGYDATPRPIAGAEHRLASGRRGAGRWTLDTRIDRAVAATPVQPDRRVAVPCLTLTTTLRSHGQTQRSPDGACALPDLVDHTAMTVAAAGGCAPVGGYVAALAHPGTARIVAVLGDGGRRTLPLRAVPGAPGVRAGVVVLGPGIAVRRVLALGAGGAVRASEPGFAPGLTDPGSCDIGGGAALIEVVLNFPRDRLGHGPHVPRATDSGPLLCLAVDRAPDPAAGGCAVPALDADHVYLSHVPTADGGYLAGIVPAEIAGATLTLDDGTTRDVAATPVPGYAGQYRDAVRVVATGLAPGRRVYRFALRDGLGRVLATVEGPDRPALTHLTTLLRAPGAPGLAVALQPRTPGAAPNERAHPCAGLAPLDLGDDNPCLIGGVPGSVVVEARCAPRRIVVWGVLGHATDRLAVRLAGGKERAGRVKALPAAIGRGGGAAGVLAVLPARAAPRRLVVRGPDRAEAVLALPPAAEQCGYTTYADLGGEEPR